MKFAVILSGCGQFDGSETHETILTLLALSQRNIQWQGLAPNITQSKTINHLDQSVMLNEKRNVLIEAARLVRGNIQDIASADIKHYDGIIIPGGFGAVSNLSDWADNAEDFNIQADVLHFLEQARNEKVPTGFICIAPMLITKLYPDAELTIGNDASIAQQIDSLGCQHRDCSVDETVVDKKNRIVSTPAYMLAQDISQAHQGIDRLVSELVDLVTNHPPS